MLLLIICDFLQDFLQDSLRPPHTLLPKVRFEGLHLLSVDEGTLDVGQLIDKYTNTKRKKS